jgi:hypothetical protein
MRLSIKNRISPVEVGDGRGALQAVQCGRGIAHLPSAAMMSAFVEDSSSCI